LLLTSIVNAQDVIEIKVSKNVLQEGENFRIDLIAREYCQIQYPDFKNFKIVGGPNQSIQQSAVMTNGRVEQEIQIIHSFILRAPDKKGTYTIDACILKCSGQNHRSNSVKIEVTEPEGGSNS